jgi:2'-5' RNA ligase
MSDQLSLDGFDAPSTPTDRLFFALLPDGDSAAQIATLTQTLRDACDLRARPVAVDRLHVTLYFLGDFPGLPRDVVTRASRAAAALTVPAFSVAFDRVMSFKNKRGGYPFVLLGGDGLASLSAFQQSLAIEMSKEGLKPADKATSFTPHVTLLYDERCVPEQAIAPISWTATEFVLVRSAIGQGRYETIARWPLGK